MSAVWTVVDENIPLIKLHSPHRKDMIVNTASPNFVSAQLVDKVAIPGITLSHA